MAQEQGYRGARDLLESCFGGGRTLGLGDPAFPAAVAAIAGGY